MRPPTTSGIGLVALLSLFTGSLLLGVSKSTSDVPNFCNKLNQHSKDFFIWALGYSGEHFYVLASDSTAYEVSQNQVVIDQDNWKIFMRPVKPKTIKKFKKSPRSTGLIGQQGSTSFALFRETYVQDDHDEESTFTVMNLDLDSPTVTVQDLDPLGNEQWDTFKSYFSSDKEGKFIVQDADSGFLYEGTLNGTSKEIHMYINRHNVLGRIKPESNSLIGFVHKGALYAMDKNWSKQRTMFKYRMDADKSMEPMASKPLDKVFHCKEMALKRVDSPSSPGIVTTVIIIIIVLVVIVLLLAFLQATSAFTRDSSQSRSYSFSVKRVQKCFIPKGAPKLKAPYSRPITMTSTGSLRNSSKTSHARKPASKN